jgi:hypothetical protein
LTLPLTVALLLGYGTINQMVCHTNIFVRRKLSDIKSHSYLPNFRNGTPKRDLKCACAEQRSIKLKNDMDRKCFVIQNFFKFHRAVFQLIHVARTDTTTTISFHIAQNAQRLFILAKILLEV